jgi:hypothetical protein
MLPVAQVLKACRSRLPLLVSLHTTPLFLLQVHWRDGMHRGPAVLLLLEVLARRVLTHHITCSKSSTSERSSAAGQLLTTLHDTASECGWMGVLFDASLLQPQQLQPRVIALAASLHKLYRSKGKSSQLHLMHATAEAARHIILDLNKTGGALHDWPSLCTHVLPALLQWYCLPCTAAQEHAQLLARGVQSFSLLLLLLPGSGFA